MTKSGFAVLLGRPNAGKSTLLNSIIGEELALVSALPQTTRYLFKGIFTDERGQVVFLDTPGLHFGKYGLNESLLSTGENVIKDADADVYLYLVDLMRPPAEEEENIIKMLEDIKDRVLFIFNKKDVADKRDEFLEVFFDKFPSFKDLPHLIISATNPKDVKKVCREIFEKLTEGPLYFDADELSDANFRFFAAEIIRGQIIHNSREEVPHASCVKITDYKENEGRHHIEATIYVESNGQKAILLGDKGSVIKKIRHFSRREMKRLTNEPVNIELKIKVKPNWRNNASFLEFIGLDRVKKKAKR